MRRADYFHIQFMPKNARIGEERLPSGERMQIRSAYPDAVNSQQRLACFGFLRRGELLLEISRLVEHDLSHESDVSK